MQLYWHKLKDGFRVTYHLQNDYTSLWTRVHGIQIGDWFFGAVKGRVITKNNEQRKEAK